MLLPRCRCRIPARRGSSDNSASRIAPEPVPRSAIRKRTIRARHRRAASPAPVRRPFRYRAAAPASPAKAATTAPKIPCGRGCARPVRRRDGARANCSRRVDSLCREQPVRGCDHAGQVEPEHLAGQAAARRVRPNRWRRSETVPLRPVARSRRFAQRRNPSCGMSPDRTGAATNSASSLRTQGPITPGLCFLGDASTAALASAGAEPQRQGVWVPAFAGTTKGVARPVSTLTPRRPGRRAGRPGARSSARRSVRRALRPRSPAAACRASG